MKTAAILGGVVLKKIFTHIDSKCVKPTLYAPKMALASLVGSGLDGHLLDELNLDSFSYSVVRRDFEKTFFIELKKASPDYLLVDFQDSVFDLFFDRRSGAVITKSNYFSKIDSNVIGLGEWDVIEKDSEHAASLWLRGFDALLNEIPLSTKVVLVKIFQPECFMSGGRPVPYSKGLQQKIERHNSFIERLYTQFSAKLRCAVLNVSSELLISQTEESIGFNPTDLGENASFAIANSFLRMESLEDAVIPRVIDKVGEYLACYKPLLRNDIPTISELHSTGCDYINAGDSERAMECERLIVLLRNSSVPLSVKMGIVSFGYGGIGVIIHSECKLGNYIKIGSNVTLGGGKVRLDDNGKRRQVPYIEDRVYIATGAKILGGVTIGNHSIIGANAVVTIDVPPFSVVAGNPAKVINVITKDNLARYSSYLYKGMRLSDVEKIVFPV